MLLVAGGLGVGGARAAPPADVETVRVERVTAAAEVEAFGRVLDPLPLVEALHARTAARAAAVVARAEHERVARLHRDQQNASTRDLESARAALDRATLELANATARGVLAWGAAFAASDALADDLVGGRAAIARVDLPAGEHVAGAPATITVAAVGDAERRLAARVLGAAPSTDPLLQGEAYLVLLGAEPPRPGTSLRATVPRQAEPLTGAAVPRAAIVWSAGRPLAYVETSPGVFERRTLTLAVALPGAWLVTEGVAPGDRVVTTGAAQLLSSEILHPLPAD